MYQTSSWGYICLPWWTENKFIHILPVSLKLLHLTVHVHCTCPLELGPKIPSSNSFSWSQVYASKWSYSIAIHAVTMTTHIAINLTHWLGTKKKNQSLAILGQAPKNLYNEHALSNVKGTLNWQNVNKFIFCTPR